MPDRRRRLRQPWRGCGGEGIAGCGARLDRGWIRYLLLSLLGVLIPRDYWLDFHQIMRTYNAPFALHGWEWF